MESTPPSDASLASEVMTSSFLKLQNLLPSAKLNLKVATKNGRRTFTLKADLKDVEAGDIEAEYFEAEDVEIEDVEAQSDAPALSCPSTTFHDFRKLPAEIQEEIWKLSLQETRIVRLNRRGAEHRWKLLTYKPPASAQACHQSRTLYHKETKHALGCRGGIHKSLRVSPSRDIVYWDGWIGDARLQQFGTVHKFENIAIKYPSDHVELRGVFDLFFGDTCGFPDIKRLIFVMYAGHLTRGVEVVFSDFRDSNEDRIWFDLDYYKWEELEDVYRSAFQEYGYPTTVDFRPVVATLVRNT